eukprot:3399564-Prymnesium_polylepis.1
MWHAHLNRTGCCSGGRGSSSQARRRANCRPSGPPRERALARDAPRRAVPVLSGLWTAALGGRAWGGVGVRALFGGINLRFCRRRSIVARAAAGRARAGCDRRETGDRTTCVWPSSSFSGRGPSRGASGRSRSGQVSR